MNIKNWRALLKDIADGVKKYDRYRVAVIEVVLHTPHGKYDFGLDQALEIIANDLFFDERGNWADATHATVGVI